MAFSGKGRTWGEKAAVPAASGSSHSSTSSTSASEMVYDPFMACYVRRSVRGPETWDVKKLREAGLGVPEFKILKISPKRTRDAGFSVADMKASDYYGEDLFHAGFSIAELKAAGIPPGDFAWHASCADMKAAGYAIEELRYCYSPQQLRDVGFTASDLVTVAGMEQHELRSAFSNEELAAVGVSVLPPHRKQQDKSRLKKCSSGCNTEISDWSETGEWNYDPEYDSGSIGQYGYPFGCAVCGRCPICRRNGCVGRPE